jgi:hypothetical protein
VLAKGVTEGALVSAGQTPVRWIRVGFALKDSNLHLQAGFPVFLSQALDWLLPRPVALARGLGTVELPLADALVTDGERRPLATTQNASMTLFEARQPDVYAVTAGGPEQLVVVNAFDPQRSEINRSRFSAVAASAAGAAVDLAGSAGLAIEPSSLLLLAAAALLLLEWLTFSRGLSV